MTTAVAIDTFPPSRIDDLTIRAVDDGAQFVVKNPRTRKYLKVGPVEAFLLERLDGQTTVDGILRAFETKFGEPLSAGELQDFLGIAGSQGLLEVPGSTPVPAANQRRTIWASVQHAWQRFRRQNPLFLRASLFDPDRFLNWLEPRTRWLWSSAFVTLAVVGFVAALIVVLLNQRELISLFATRLHWQTFVIAWATIIAATICHEFGHGLACKRHGGEVHEIGVLLMVFTHFLYCNV